MKHRDKFVAVLLLGVALGSHALTLGRLRGAAWIGQALDVVVPVQFDATESGGNLCPHAEVFHADSRADPSRVRVGVEPLDQGAQIRIRSGVAVDEPVVTVYLRVGCTQSSTRRFVLLADMPSDSILPALDVTSSSRPADAGAVAASAMPGRVVGAEPAQREASGPEPIKQTPRVRATPRGDGSDVVTHAASAAGSGAARRLAASRAQRPAASRTGRARLKLEAMDFLSDRIANLDSPISFAPAEDTLRNAQRVQALEDDVKALRLQASRNDALVQGLRAQLAQAQSERTPAVLLYTMGVLLVFCLAAVALLWARLRQVQQGAQAWWQGQSEHVDVGAIPDTQPGLTAEESRLSTLSPGPMPHGDSPAFPPIKPAGPVAAPLPHRLPPASALSEFLADMPVTGAAAGYSVTEMHDSSFDDMLAGNVRRRVVPSHGLAGRLNSDAERDVRQQAEFFLSLGQTGRAVQVLQKEVDESAEVGPHIFLDLLALYHSLGQRAPFDALRGRFAREFAGRVPEFAAFRDEGRALDAYPEVLARITASWGTASGRPVLEACIFRDAAMPVNFDLLAFRELLLLHAVSTELAGGSAVTPEPLPVPGAVDLDLSERGVAQDGEDVDLPLPMLPPVDADTAPVPAAIAPGGNLLDFNLPPSQPKT